MIILSAPKWLLPLICALFPILVEPAMAHTTYFGHRGEEIPLFFDHPETDPSGLGPGLPYDTSKIEEVMAFDTTGAASPIQIIDRGTGISIIPSSGLAVLTASVDTGFFVVTADGEPLNLSKTEADAMGVEYISSFRAFQSAKGIYDWSPFVSQPFNLPLEIVILEDPFNLEVGALLPVAVLLQGNPVENALVEYNFGQATTDNNGIALVPFNLDVLGTIEASYSIPLDNDPETDELIFSTTTDVQSVPESSGLLAIGVFGLLTFVKSARKTVLSRSQLSLKTF